MTITARVFCAVDVPAVLRESVLIWVAACGSLLSFVAATEAAVQCRLLLRLSALARATEAAG